MNRCATRSLWHASLALACAEPNVRTLPSHAHQSPHDAPAFGDPAALSESSFFAELRVEFHVLLEAVVLLSITSYVTVSHAQVELLLQVEELVPLSDSFLPFHIPLALLVGVSDQIPHLVFSSHTVNSSSTRTMGTGGSG